MAEIISHSDWQSVRITAGSPATLFTFPRPVKVISIENLGTGSCFYSFDKTATAGSDIPMLKENYFRSFNLTVGSVSVYGTDAPEVQIIGLF